MRDAVAKARVLLVGISTRALAESAVRAGYSVVSVDGYGDLDNPAEVTLSLARDFGVEYSAHAAAMAASGLELEYDAVCYGSTFENHPSGVQLLARRAELWGNSPAVLRRARDPVRLSRLLSSKLGSGALVRASAPAPRTPGAPGTPREWLAKPRASGGGHEISIWRPGDPLPRTHILQERIMGIPGSIAFVAHDGNAIPFAISRQLVGEAAFGASAFQYCGSILSDHPPCQIDAAVECAQLLTEELTLTGLACLDFVARDGIPHAIELNPRYSASMELTERAFAFPVFEAHARACARHVGPTVTSAPHLDLTAALRSTAAFGKAVLFAPDTLTMGDTRPWLADPDVRDVPHSGETIPRGHPVCTIFATARNDADCYEQLVRKAGRMYDEMREQTAGSREQKLQGAEDRGQGTVLESVIPAQAGTHCRSHEPGSPLARE